MKMSHYTLKVSLQIYAVACMYLQLRKSKNLNCYQQLSLLAWYSNNKMLQRIYGTAFFDKKDLNTLEERKNDHRKIGKN